MRLPCETASKSVVPAIRAFLAKELTHNYGMKQIEAANLIGITQTAISKYTHNERGSILQLEKEIDVRMKITSIASSLAKGRLNKEKLVNKICDTCRLIRGMGLMCELCKSSNTSVAMEDCKICKSSSKK